MGNSVDELEMVSSRFVEVEFFFRSDILSWSSLCIIRLT